MNEFNVTFEPAKIEVLDREKFEEQINSIAQANSNRLVTIDSMADDKKTRAELRKLSKSLNDEKIRIKKEYNQPLTEFEVWFKTAVEVLEKAISQIDSGIKEVEAEQKEERKKVVHELLIELTADTEVDSRIFESFVDDWAKASNFNDVKPKKQVIDSITYVIDGEKQKIEDCKANKETISNFCFGNNVSDTPYIRMLDSGKSVSEVMSAISEDVLFEKKRKEAEEKRKEVEKQRQAELEKQQQEFETRKLEASFNSAASVSTEIIQSEPEKTESSPDEEIAEVSRTEIVQKYRAVIEICFSSLEEKNKWKQVMVDNGFEDFKAKEFEEIKPEVVEND